MRHNTLTSESQFFPIAPMSWKSINNVVRGGQYELLDWLKNVTFPKEAQFKEEEYAKEVYPDVVRRSLDCGVRYSPLVHWILFMLRASDDDVMLLRYPSPRSYQDSRENCEWSR